MMQIKSLSREKGLNRFGFVCIAPVTVFCSCFIACPIAGPNPPRLVPTRPAQSQPVSSGPDASRLVPTHAVFYIPAEIRPKTGRCPAQDRPRSGPEMAEVRPGAVRGPVQGRPKFGPRLLKARFETGPSWSTVHRLSIAGLGVGRVGR